MGDGVGVFVARRRHRNEGCTIKSQIGGRGGGTYGMNGASHSYATA